MLVNKRTNFKEKNMKKLILAATLTIGGTALADLVPGGSGSPASFPSGISVGGNTLTDIDSGTYNCVTSDLVNNTGGECHGTQYWSRVGNVVHVAVNIRATVTVADTLTELKVTLPVASNFTSFVDCNGGGGWSSGNSFSAVRVVADTASDKCTIRWAPTTTGLTDAAVIFTYIVK